MRLKQGGLIARIPILAAVMLTLACPQGVVVAQDVASAVLSERVGNTIDTYERRYFSLLPGVKGFDSAVVSPRNDALLFRVARYNMPDTVIKVNPALTGIFRSYIEDFELLFDTRYPENREEMQKRGLLVNQCLKLQSAGLVRFRESIQQEAPEVTVVLADSTGIPGRILALRNSALMIWRTGKAYRWKDLSSSLAVVSMKDVKGIIRTGQLCHRVFCRLVGYIHPDLHRTILAGRCAQFSRRIYGGRDDYCYKFPGFHRCCPHFRSRVIGGRTGRPVLSGKQARRL